MLKKILASALLISSFVFGQSALAAVTTNLNLNFQSGATFTGTLTFSNNYDALLDVSGTLSGGPYGSANIHWAWWLGTAQPYTAIDYDGNPNTYEDWLMDGTEGASWNNYIGISWYWPVNGDLQLALVPNTSAYHAGVNFVDAIISYDTNVPEPASLALIGLGLAGLGFARRRKI